MDSVFEKYNVPEDLHKIVESFDPKPSHFYVMKNEIAWRNTFEDIKGDGCWYETGEDWSPYDSSWVIEMEENHINKPEVRSEISPYKHRRYDDVHNKEIKHIYSVNYKLEKVTKNSIKTLPNNLRHGSEGYRSYPMGYAYTSITKWPQVVETPPAAIEYAWDQIFEFGNLAGTGSGEGAGIYETLGDEFLEWKDLSGARYKSGLSEYFKEESWQKYCQYTDCSSQVF
tara:strand:- start:2105 stop:2785 length:681 start_codon:yes stop_codon:yes gene_type:complete